MNRPTAVEEESSNGLEIIKSVAGFELSSLCNSGLEIRICPRGDGVLGWKDHRPCPWHVRDRNSLVRRGAADNRCVATSLRSGYCFSVFAVFATLPLFYGSWAFPLVVQRRILDPVPGRRCLGQMVDYRHSRPCDRREYRRSRPSRADAGRVHSFMNGEAGPRRLAKTHACGRTWHISLLRPAVAYHCVQALAVQRC
jgi:hypothetical protein